MTKLKTDLLALEIESKKAKKEVDELKETLLFQENAKYALSRVLLLTYPTRNQYQTELLFLQQKLESTDKKLKLVSDTTQTFHESDLAQSTWPEKKKRNLTPISEKTIAGLTTELKDQQTIADQLNEELKAKSNQLNALQYVISYCDFFSNVQIRKCKL